MALRMSCADVMMGLFSSGERWGLLVGVEGRTTFFPFFTASATNMGGSYLSNGMVKISGGGVTGRSIFIFVGSFGRASECHGPKLVCPRECDEKKTDPLGPSLTHHEGPQNRLTNSTRKDREHNEDDGHGYQCFIPQNEVEGTKYHPI